MNISMKKGLLALVGAVALAGAGSAQAVSATFQGQTTLTDPTGTQVTCTLTLNGDVTGGVVTVMSGTVTAGDPLCAAIVLSPFNWTGTIQPNPTSDPVGTLTLAGAGASIPSIGLNCVGDVSGIITTTQGSVAPAGSGVPDHAILSNLPLGSSGCTIDGTLTYQ